MRSLDHAARAGAGPLRLAIEPHVRCPRGGLVPVERCFGCDLLQGTLAGDRPAVLCAYSEVRPALQRRTVAVGPGRPHARVERARAGLIFDRDWPDE